MGEGVAWALPAIGNPTSIREGQGEATVPAVLGSCGLCPRVPDEKLRHGCGRDPTQ